MSLFNFEESERMYFTSAGREGKNYRNAVKIRLKELIEEGSEVAKKRYDELFPKYEIKPKRDACQYQSRITDRMKENIPYLICKTCGKISDRVREFEDPTLRFENRKTWRRTIKSNLNYFVFFCNKKLRNRRIFFATNMISCLRKKHKLQIKFREHKTITQMKYDYIRSKA
jgi:hypothetical protein